MNRKLHGKRSGVIVDSCREHGIWLDAGELRQLMEWSRAGGEKLNQEDRAFEKQQDTEHERRKQLAEYYQKNKLELDPSFEYSAETQQAPTSFLDLLTEAVRDLLG
jgi:Zn-finger nucleic acid-binding protein